MHHLIQSSKIIWRGNEHVDFLPANTASQRTIYGHPYAYIADENGEPQLVYRRIPCEGGQVFITDFSDNRGGGSYLYNIKERNPIVINRLEENFATLYSPLSVNHPKPIIKIKDYSIVGFIMPNTTNASQIAITDQSFDIFDIYEEDDEDIMPFALYDCMDYWDRIWIDNEGIINPVPYGDKMNKLTYSLGQDGFTKLQVEEFSPVRPSQGISLVSAADRLYFGSAGTTQEGEWYYRTWTFYDVETGEHLNTIHYRTKSTTFPLLKLLYNNMSASIRKEIIDGVDRVVCRYCNVVNDGQWSMSYISNSLIDGGASFFDYHNGQYYFKGIKSGVSGDVVIKTSNFQSFSQVTTIPNSLVRSPMTFRVINSDKVNSISLFASSQVGITHPLAKCISYWSDENKKSANNKLLKRGNSNDNRMLFGIPLVYKFKDDSYGIPNGWYYADRFMSYAGGVDMRAILVVDFENFSNSFVVFYGEYPDTFY